MNSSDLVNDVCKLFLLIDLFMSPTNHVFMFQLICLFQYDLIPEDLFSLLFLSLDICGEEDFWWHLHKFCRFIFYFISVFLILNGVQNITTQMSIFNVRSFFLYKPLHQIVFFPRPNALDILLWSPYCPPVIYFFQTVYNAKT